MILRPHQIYLLRMSGRASICNGGDSDSDASTNTTSTTTENVNQVDRRSVASDAAVSVTGDGNTIDRSTQNLTSFIDNSSKSTLTSFVDSSNRSTSFSDSSDRSTKFTDNSSKDSSTHFTDNSNRSVNTTVTDYGSVGGSLTMAGAMSSKALEGAGDAITGAVSSLKQTSSDNMKSISKAFDTAAGQSAMASASSAAVIGFASDALKSTQEAFATAKDGGQSKMVLAALAVAGAVGVAVALK